MKGTVTVQHGKEDDLSYFQGKPVFLSEICDLIDALTAPALSLCRPTFPNTNAEQQKGADELTEETDPRNADLIGLTADIIAAFVQNNPVPVAGLRISYLR